MSYISVFDVLGPDMIGPSSSHTAGAAVIAFLAHKMIAPPLEKVEFTLYGSFSKTYRGHGTDRALLGGIMGFGADDARIRNSFQIAAERGLAYSFAPCDSGDDIHPNTVDIRMENAMGRVVTVRGESLGGGKVRISRINGVSVDFTGDYSTVIVVQQDKPGVVAYITKVLSDSNVNIAFMRLFREAKGHTGLYHRGIRWAVSGGDCGVAAYQSECARCHDRGAVEKGERLWNLILLRNFWSCAGKNIALSLRSCAAGNARWVSGPGMVVDHQMAQALEIMRNSASQPLKNPVRSMGGLIGGEAKKLYRHAC